MGAKLPGLPSDCECAVCFSRLSGVAYPKRAVWDGKLALFCSRECFEIFQHNPEFFFRRWQDFPEESELYSSLWPEQERRLKSRRTV